MSELDPNSSDRAYQRAHQDDPMIMHIVVLKTTDASSGVLLDNAAKAALCSQIELEPTYPEEFNQWWSESFRKIALKAKQAQWNRLLERDDYVRIGDVLTFVPVKRSLRNPLFNKLQVLSNLDATRDGQDTGSARRPRDSVKFYILSNLSLGKQVAQIAHASMMLGKKIGFHKVADSNFHIIFTKSLPETESRNSIIVRDAGLTEIESGTETVLAKYKKR